ncbi:MAG: rod shape-determining protein MreD [Acidimicrobiales bacterium]
MTALKVGLVCVVALALQLTVFVDVHIDGVAPELLALVAVLAGSSAGADRGSVIAFGVGLLWDIYLPTPLGLAAISFALVAYAVGGLEAGLFHDTRVQVAVLAFVGTASTLVIYTVLGELVGQRGLVSGDLVRIVLVASLVNSVLAPFVAPAVQWAVRLDLRRHPTAVNR